MDRLWRITGLDPAGKSRFSLLLEGWGSEAVVLGDCTYVLYTREGEHSGLWELDGAGELRRRWQVPAGGFSLSASGGQLCFAVRAAAQEGGQLARLLLRAPQRLPGGEAPHARGALLAAAEHSWAPSPRCS
jgi:hypothetical protein